MGEAEAHLCPVRALAEWIDASQIQSGYLFRKIVSGDRVSQNDVPLVGFTCIVGVVISRFSTSRHLSSFLRCFATTCLTSASILLPTAHTLFDGVAVSTWLPNVDGRFAEFVNGVGGALSFPI